MNPEDFKGVYSALYTPYDADGKVNPAMVEKLIDFHYRNGLRGCYVLGSTGEGPFLEMDERKNMAKAAVNAGRGRMKIIIHVGHIQSAKAAELAAHAESVGADAVSSITPFYYPYSPEVEFRHYETIATASALPFLIYANPAIAGKDISEKSLLRLFTLETVKGVKFTGSDFSLFNNIIRKADKEIIWFSGSDQLMIAGMMFGSYGSIGTYQNILPRPFAKLWELFQQGKIAEARKLQFKINEFLFFTVGIRDFSYAKMTMRYLGFDSGCMKLPFKQISESEYQEFTGKLKKFDELFSMSK